MKTQEFVLTCSYSEDETCIVQIIQSSFGAFLKKELQNLEKLLCSGIPCL